MEYFPVVLQSAFGGVITGVIYIAIVRVQIQWLRRDVDFLLKKHDDDRGKL